MTESTPTISVLVVDDSPIYRKLIEHAFEEEVYSPIFAKSGREALELYKKHAPQIVITDWMMPDYSGLELCQKIRNEAGRPYTYIVVITGNTEKANLVEALEAGADDYITKPFDTAEFLARVGVGRRTIGLHREIDAKNKLLEEMAHTDPLTGLPNRRAIQDWATRQLRGAKRHGYSLWVVHTDLDCFKEINDKFGHEAGDEVLKRVAEVIRNCTRASDIGGRMGGDEFLSVLTHLEEKHIEMTVERLRQQISLQKFSFDGKVITVTASFGVCGFVGGVAPDLSTLVRRADQALYSAKRSGKNRIKIELL